MKRMIGLTLACTMLCSLAMPVSADDVLFTVDCSVKNSNSESDVWATFKNDGVLTISGTGKMDSYFLTDGAEESPDYPWTSDEYKNAVTSIVIEEGVTFVDVFSMLPELKHIHFANSIESINPFDWALCLNLETAFIPAGIDTTETGNVFKFAADNFTVYGYKNTTAEEFAGRYEYNFHAMGDMNSDGSVDLSDATEILNRFARAGAGIDEPETEDGVPDTADVNQDETVGIDDATIALTYYASAAAGEEFNWTELVFK